MSTIKNLAGLGKAEYLLRPHQIARRLWREAEGRRPEVKTVRLPWGPKIAVNTADSLGWSLYTRAIYETPVTEALWRLVQSGDSVVDGGANIGYMTSVLAVRAGQTGRVYCFEPHPRVFSDLQQNVTSWKGCRLYGSFLLHQAALGAQEGFAELHVADFFSANQGVARIEPGGKPGEGQSFRVKVLALDDVIPKDETIRVVKLDIEGYELAALNGMQGLLRARRVRHIVFEEMQDFPAATHQFLGDMGYAIFGIDRHFSGIRLVRDRKPYSDPVSGSPPNYLATIEPEFAISRLQSGIWQSFGPAQLLSRWL